MWHLCHQLLQLEEKTKPTSSHVSRSLLSQLRLCLLLLAPITAVTAILCFVTWMQQGHNEVAP
jgi:hypothetical protein